MICFSLSAVGDSSVPSISGTLGPYTSASSKPTDAPRRCSAMARLTATVVLPTPPFPLATAIKFFTPGIGGLAGWGGGVPGGIGGIRDLSNCLFLAFDFQLSTFDSLGIIGCRVRRGQAAHARTCAFAPAPPTG